ncbi:MAG: hypothetical protein WC371_02885 [Parachlamydiales bacterium]|jgi:hypothetical protein
MLQKKFHFLVRETLLYLQKETRPFYFLNAESYRFFQPLLPPPRPSRQKKIPPSPPALEEKIPPPPSLKTITLNKAPFPILPPLVRPSEPAPALEKKTDFREMEKPIPVLPVSFQHFKDLLFLVDPNLKILEEIPEDTKAKEIASSWKLKAKVGRITILSYGETEKELFFLKELARAVHLLFQPTKIINAASLEKENKWEAYLNQPHLKLMIISDSSLWKLKNLLTHYHENPISHETFLKNTPLLLMPQISLYFKEPLMKKTLYETLKKKALSL